MSKVLDTIKIKRLVLVDSAGFCFIEIPIDRHAILLGKGNIGKSSVLNSLRLFLLPEHNFNKSQIKFAFREPKKNDYYSNNDSYRHYFPSMRSFLILESENEAGTHCQILYRTNNLGYGRIFTPFSFDKIRHFFWDASGDDDGIGRAVADLSIADIKDKLKRLSPKTEIISDPAKLRHTLYAEANDLLDSDSSRYCLVPLHKVNDDNIESLRALILLLFEMDASAESMALALANIIESGKKTTDDILDFDVDTFLSKHDDLKQQRAHIVELRNLQPEFIKLTKDYDSYRRLSESDKTYVLLTKSILHQQKKSNQAALDSAKQFRKEDDIKGEHKAILNEVRKEIAGAKTLLADSVRRRKEQDEIIRKVGILQAQYPENYHLSEIKSCLQDYIEEIDKEISALQTTEGNIQLKAELEGKIAQCKRDIIQTKQSLESKEFQLVEQLPEQASMVLSAINKNIMMANPNRKMTDEELSGINHFTGLFSDEGDSLQWFDQHFSKQTVDVGENLQRKLDDTTADLFSHEKTHTNISIEKDAISQKTEIDKLKKKRKASESDINNLDHYPASLVVEQEGKNSAQYKATIEKLDKKEEKHQASFDKSQKKAVELKQVKDEKEKAVGELNRLKRTLGRLELRYSRLKKLSMDDIELTQPIGVSEERIEQLDSDLREFERLRERIQLELKDLQRRGFVDERALLSQAPNNKVMESGINQLRDTFNDLDNIEKAYLDYLHSHNESVASYAKVLRDNNEIIHRFETSINRELSSVTINDLTEIKATIAVHPKFRHLVDEINKLDQYSDNMLSDQFYERLKVFVETFFKEGDSRLTMDKIITNLSYETRKKNDDERQGKAQSTSTTVLINLELVKILLKRVIPTGIRLEMPLVFDEAADINIDQFDWILPNLSDAGFSLFAAATHSVSTELIHKIGLWFSVDEMMTSQPYDNKRTLVFWNGGEGVEPLGSEYLTDLALADQTDWIDQNE